MTARASTCLNTYWWNKSLFWSLSSRVAAVLPLSRTSSDPLAVALPFSDASSSARNAMTVAWVVPQAPCALFFEAMKFIALAAVAVFVLLLISA